MAYDIFISYRRRGAGAGVAGELQSKLENLGFKVFLDVDKIGSGEFPDQIKHAIEECKDFLLVLAPHSRPLHRRGRLGATRNTHGSEVRQKHHRRGASGLCHA